MTNSLFLFGNGLGMSIDPNFYSIESGLNRARDDSGLTDADKALIYQALGRQSNSDDAPPKSEDEFFNLQKIVNACDFISQFEQKSDVTWLTPEGAKFPDAIGKFIFEVASTYMSTEEYPPDNRTLKLDFAKSLIDFISEQGAHIVTLNYDDLLYDKINKSDITTEGVICDGFLKGRFDFATSEKWYQKQYKLRKNISWFLHLHGSPLFQDDEKGGQKKLKRPELRDWVVGFQVLQNKRSRHIVLTHSSHKEDTIHSSPILKKYWSKFLNLLEECNNIILFGYGGLDPHVNIAIREKCPPDAKIRIVEWADPKATHQDRCKFWAKELDRQIEECDIIRLGDIQEFRDWAMPT